MSDGLLTGTLYGMNHALRQTANNYADKIDELRAYRKQDAQIIAERDKTIAEYIRSVDQWRCHYAGLEARCEAAMKHLDEAYGVENNPMRKAAYAEDEPTRIPAGPNKGKRVTMADYIYINRFADAFNKNFTKHAKSWIQFISDGIYE